MTRDHVLTVVKLLVACFIVGAILSVFGLTPLGLVAGIASTFEKMFDNLVGFLTGTLDFLLLGAIVVLPVWLVFRLMSGGRQKKSGGTGTGAPDQPGRADQG